jgi:hypothetical protein
MKTKIKAKIFDLQRELDIIYNIFNNPMNVEDATGLDELALQRTILESKIQVLKELL